MGVSYVACGQFVGPLAVGPELSPVHELAFGNPFSKEGYLAQQRERGMGLVMPQLVLLDFG